MDLAETQADSGTQAESGSLLKLDLPAYVHAVAGATSEPIWAATHDAIAALAKHEYAVLSRHSPGLTGYDWSGYLRLSSIRLAHMAFLLERRGIRSGRLLDYGSYFGNFALFARRLGFETWALDSYRDYEGVFEPSIRTMTQQGIHIVDFSEIGHEMAALPPDSFDIVLCMGVIEHIAHTPRPLLEAIRRVLRPGGVLIVETPNLAYAYTRRKLAEGRPIGPPIELQFETEIPFQGHHREYTLHEVLWMLRRIGYESVDSLMYNFSLYGMNELAGADLQIFRAMEGDASLRELIMTSSINAKT